MPRGCREIRSPTFQIAFYGHRYYMLQVASGCGGEQLVKKLGEEKRLEI